MAEGVTSAAVRKARLLALVVPAAERRELERRFGADVRPAGLSAIVGLFEFWLGVAIYAFAHPGLGGGFGIVAWHLNPVAWLGLLTMVTALLRVASYLANNDSFGEPLVWLFLRLRQLKEGAEDRRAVHDTLGPVRPDRIVVDREGIMALLASREKPGWDEYNTVRIEDRFFKIEAVQERPDGARMAVGYVLSEVPETEVLRGIVHTDAKLPSPVPRGC